MAYHLHNQTYVWPIDPYYEHMSRQGSSRREKFMEYTHKWCEKNKNKGYHGPGSARGWKTNKRLDPIITKYTQMNPWQPSIVLPDKKWLVYNTPKEITNKIADLHLVIYDAPPNDKGLGIRVGKIASKPGSTGKATDHLICFEGGTGGLDSIKEHAWSVMGYVLVRKKTQGKGYDIHIAFRGSRSGRAGRAVAGGAARLEDGGRGKAWGNPDWVTDISSMVNVKQMKEISRHGSVSEGFGMSVKSMLPTIAISLRAAHKIMNGKAPENIYVTGHSLGGALAALFSSAVMIGTDLGPQGSKLPEGVRDWPWKRMRLITFSAPTVGGKRFHYYFNSKVHARRVMLASDPITQSIRNYHVGARVYLPGKLVKSTFEYHEPWRVRNALIRASKRWGESLDGVPAKEADRKTTHAPWRYYDSFAELWRLGNNGGRWADPGKVFRGFSKEFPEYLSILGEIVGISDIYKWKTGSLRDKEALGKRKEQVDKAIDKLQYASEDNIHIYWREYAVEAKGIQGKNSDRFLGFCMVLAALAAGGNESELRHIVYDPDYAKLIAL